MSAINTEWDFVEPDPDDIAILELQRGEGGFKHLPVAINTHVALERIDNEGNVKVRWLLTARVVLQLENCATPTAADFRARVPCSMTMSLEQANANWNLILLNYLVEEWIPMYAEMGCNDEA